VTQKKADQVFVDLYAHFARWRGDLLRIEARCFGPRGDNEEELESGIKRSLFLAVIRKGDVAMGYCLVSRRWPETAYINFTAIDPDYQDKGFLGKLISTVEDELVTIGYTHIERDCRIENGYADKVEKFYGDRIDVKYDHRSLLGPLRFFRIRLKEPSVKGALPTGEQQKEEGGG
jgi:GNAT superfamily N-acetyltransferase